MNLVAFNRHYQEHESLRLLQLQYRANIKRELFFKAYASNFVQSKSNNSKEFYRMLETKVFSQNGEDGILIYLLMKLNLINLYEVPVDGGSRFWFDIGCGGKSSNVRILTDHFKWSGIGIDSNLKQLEMQKKEFEKIANSNVIFLNEMVSEENVDKIYSFYTKCAPDVISIDIDSFDHYIFAGTMLNPAIIIIEYNSQFAEEMLGVRKTAPIKDFSKFNLGASLAFLVALAKHKGYTLICCESSGVNAFFVRTDLAEKYHIPSVEWQIALYPNVHLGNRIIEQGTDKLEKHYFSDLMHFLEELSAN